MSKRGENIYKRKDHRWEGRVKLEMEDQGRAIYKSVYAHSYLECKNKLKGISKGNVPSTTMDGTTFSTITFVEICHQWLLQIKPTIKESSFAIYHNIVVNHMSAYFKKKKIVEINKDVVNDFVVTLRKRSAKDGRRCFSINTINKIVTVLKAVFNFLEQQYAVKIPFISLKMLKPCVDNESYLSSYEWEKISKVLAVAWDETAVAIAIGLYTGMRIGEICALKKQDISFNAKTIQVRRTVQRIKNIGMEGEAQTKIIISTPKSATSLRKIPIPDILLEKLQKLCLKKADNGFLLGIEDERVLEPRTLQYRFKSFLKKSGIRDIHFHALRHLFATRCIEKNMDIKTLSEILGHASVKITLEKYVHSSMEFKRIQINRLDQAI